MITDVVSWVILGVRAAARLSETARQQYIRQTRSRTLTLPLPRFFAQTNAFDARAYFEGPGQHWLTNTPSATLSASQQLEIQSLLTSFPELQPHQKDALRHHHARCLSLDKLTTSPDNLAPEEEAFLSSTTIQAWQQPPPSQTSPLQSSATDLIQTCLSLQQSLNLDFSDASPVTPFLQAFFAGLHTTPASTTTPISPLSSQLCNHALRWATSIPPTSPNSLPPHLQRTTRNTLHHTIRFLTNPTSNDPNLTLQQAATAFQTLLPPVPESLPPPDSAQHDFLQWYLSLTPDASQLLQPAQLKAILRSLTVAHRNLPTTPSLPPRSLQPLLTQLTQTIIKTNPSLLLPALPDYTHALLTETLALPPSTAHDLLDPRNNPPLHYLTLIIQTTANTSFLPHPDSLASLAVSTTHALCQQPGWKTLPQNQLRLLLDSLQNTLTIPHLPPHTRSTIFLAAIHAACQRLELTQPQHTPTPLLLTCVHSTLHTLLNPDLPQPAAWQLHHPNHIASILQITLRSLSRAHLHTNPLPAIHNTLSQLIQSTSLGAPFSPRQYQRLLRHHLQPPTPAPCPDN